MKIQILTAIIILVSLFYIIPYSANAKIISVSANMQVLALDDNGTVWAWGDNEYGQLGIGLIGGDYGTPQMVHISNVEAISAGGASSFALKNDGTVWAWGYGDDGRLGYGGYKSQSTPVQVKNLTDIVAIAAGDQTCFALKNDGTVWAWGDNQAGQLGDGTLYGDGTNDYNFISAPVQVIRLSNIKALGERGYFAIKDDGTVYEWGELGDIPGSGIRAIPFQVKGVNDVKQITGEMNWDNTTVYIKNDGTVWSWEANDISQPPVDLNLDNVIKVSRLGSHTIALKEDGTVWFWGAYIDRKGSMDNSGVEPTNKGGEPSPIKINSLDNVVDISSGTVYVVVLKKDGSIWGWGHNDNQVLGNGKNTVEVSPILLFSGITPSATPIVTFMPSAIPVNASQVPSFPAKDSNGTVAQMSGFTFYTLASIGCVLLFIDLLSEYWCKRK